MGYVARSKCYIQLGLPKKALQDAERTLKDDDKYYRVSWKIFQSSMIFILFFYFNKKLVHT